MEQLVFDKDFIRKNLIKKIELINSMYIDDGLIDSVIAVTDSLLDYLVDCVFEELSYLYDGTAESEEQCYRQVLEFELGE